MSGVPTEFDPLSALLLPRGYKRLKGIYCDNNTHGSGAPIYAIDTLYFPTASTKIDIDMTLLPNTNAEDIGGIIGVMNFATNRFHINFNSTSEDPQLVWIRYGYQGDTINTGMYTPLRQRVHISMDANHGLFTVNGVSEPLVGSYSLIGANYFTFFGRAHREYYDYGINCIFYSASFYENDILVRRYVPAQRKSDGVNGLYELVQDEFFTNSRSGGNFKAL